MHETGGFWPDIAATGALHYLLVAGINDDGESPDAKMKSGSGGELAFPDKGDYVPQATAILGIGLAITL